MFSSFLLLLRKIHTNNVFATEYENRSAKLRDHLIVSLKSAQAVEERDDFINSIGLTELQAQMGKNVKVSSSGLACVLYSPSQQ